jgi:serine/threonine-protein kinase
MACSREFTGFQVCPHDGNTLVAIPGAQDQWIGKRLADRYQIQSKLGTGGMGVVYLAWHELMERQVAIKMLKAAFIQDELSVKRFQQEAKAASRLKHPNVITLYDFGVTPNGQPYMVMDYLVGYDADHKAESLSQIIKNLGQVPAERCIHIIAQACDALDHAHRQGVIHRDVKPANIMIVPTEADVNFVKVVDFGVAKLTPLNTGGEESQSLTQAGEVCGSPVYMSPEQCLGQSLDARADIYSMGVVLYEALTGKLPLVGKNMVETMSKHMNEAPPSFKESRPDLYLLPRIEEIVMRAMSKEPHNRQQSMSELAQDLRFAIPKPGQTGTSLRALDSRAMPKIEAAQPAQESSPGWLMPAVAVGIVGGAALIGILLFHPQQPAPVTPNPVAPPQAVPPPATTAPLPPGSLTQPASSSTNQSAAANSTPGSTKPPEHPAEQTTSVAHETSTAPTHEAHTASTSSASTSHHATHVHPPTKPSPPKHKQPAPAPPAASHEDPFERLKHKRTYDN